MSNPKDNQPPLLAALQRIDMLVDRHAYDFAATLAECQDDLRMIRDVARSAVTNDMLMKNTIRPTYYVRHPDGTYSVVDPQLDYRGQEGGTQ